MFRTRKRLAKGMYVDGDRLDEIDAAKVEVHDELRFSCHGCGLCCSGVYRVDLFARDVERIEALDLEGALGLSLHDVINDDEDHSSLEMPSLRQRDERCVLLTDDGLCALHLKFGRDAKPRACRIFPFEPIVTPRGGLIRKRPECGSQHLGWRDGDLIEERKAATWRDLIKGEEMVFGLPSTVRLKPRRTCSYDTYRDARVRWCSEEATSWLTMLEGIVRTLDLSPRKRAWKAIERAVVSVDPDSSIPEILQHRDAPELASHLACIDQSEPIRDVLRSYTLDVLSGDMLFVAYTLADGAGLLALSLFGARLQLALQASRDDEPLDAERMNNSLLDWYGALFNFEFMRVQLQYKSGRALRALAPLVLEAQARGSMLHEGAVGEPG